jgi:hypothetical protein
MTIKYLPAQTELVTKVVTKTISPEMYETTDGNRFSTRWQAEQYEEWQLLEKKNNLTKIDISVKNDELSLADIAGVTSYNINHAWLCLTDNPNGLESMFPAYFGSGYKFVGNKYGTHSTVFKKYLLVAYNDDGGDYSYLEFQILSIEDMIKKLDESKKLLEALQ